MRHRELKPWQEKKLKCPKERLQTTALGRGHTVGAEKTLVDCCGQPIYVMCCKTCGKEGVALPCPNPIETELSGDIITQNCTPPKGSK